MVDSSEVKQDTAPAWKYFFKRKLTVSEVQEIQKLGDVVEFYNAKLRTDPNANIAETIRDFNKAQYERDEKVLTILSECSGKALVDIKQMEYVTMIEMYQELYQRSTQLEKNSKQP